MNLLLLLLGSEPPPIWWWERKTNLFTIMHLYIFPVVRRTPYNLRFKLTRFDSQSVSQLKCTHKIKWRIWKIQPPSKPPKVDPFPNFPSAGKFIFPFPNTYPKKSCFGVVKPSISSRKKPETRQLCPSFHDDFYCFSMIVDHQSSPVGGRRR